VAGEGERVLGEDWRTLNHGAVQGSLCDTIDGMNRLFGTIDRVYRVYQRGGAPEGTDQGRG